MWLYDAWLSAAELPIIHQCSSSITSLRLQICNTVMKIKNVIESTPYILWCFKAKPAEIVHWRDSLMAWHVSWTIEIERVTCRPMSLVCSAQTVQSLCFKTKFSCNIFFKSKTVSPCLVNNGSLKVLLLFKRTEILHSLIFLTEVKHPVVACYTFPLFFFVTKIKI